MERKNGVYLSVKTCEVFLCFVAIVRVRVCYVDFFVFFCFTSLVSVTGSYTEDEPKNEVHNFTWLDSTSTSTYLSWRKL